VVALVKVVMTTYESIFCSREGRVQRLAMQYDVLHKLYCCHIVFIDVVCVCGHACTHTHICVRMHHIIQNHIDCYLV
jgi:hypothetical protein